MDEKMPRDIVVAALTTLSLHLDHAIQELRVCAKRIRSVKPQTVDDTITVCAIIDMVEALEAVSKAILKEPPNHVMNADAVLYAADSLLFARRQCLNMRNKRLHAWYRKFGDSARLVFWPAVQIAEARGEEAGPLRALAGGSKVLETEADARSLIAKIRRAMVLEAKTKAEASATPTPDLSGAVESKLWRRISATPQTGPVLCQNAGVKYNSQAKQILANWKRQKRCSHRSGSGGGYYLDRPAKS